MQVLPRPVYDPLPHALPLWPHRPDLRHAPSAERLPLGKLRINSAPPMQRQSASPLPPSSVFGCAPPVLTPVQQALARLPPHAMNLLAHAAALEHPLELPDNERRWLRSDAMRNFWALPGALRRLKPADLLKHHEIGCLPPQHQRLTASQLLHIKKHGELSSDYFELHPLERVHLQLFTEQRLAYAGLLLGRLPQVAGLLTSRLPQLREVLATRPPQPMGGRKGNTFTDVPLLLAVTLMLVVKVASDCGRHERHSQAPEFFRLAFGVGDLRHNVERQMLGGSLATQDPMELRSLVKDAERELLVALGHEVHVTREDIGEAVRELRATRRTELSVAGDKFVRRLFMEACADVYLPADDFIDRAALLALIYDPSNRPTRGRTARVAATAHDEGAQVSVALVAASSPIAQTPPTPPPSARSVASSDEQPSDDSLDDIPIMLEISADEVAAPQPRAETTCPELPPRPARPAATRRQTTAL